MKNAVTDLSSKYEIVIEPNEYGGYYVRIPDFRGIFTGGETWEEALRHAREALEATVEAMRKQKIPLPEPKMKFSGQFNVRVPRELHRKLFKMAKDEAVSLNALISHLLTESLAKAS